MRIAVLGAGLLGVSSAWHLAADGHEVTVIDRQPEAARETSFANGGQISTSHAEPWANPGVLPKILKWLGREDSPLLWRLRADAAQWEWGVRFLRECTPARTRANIVAILRLALYSRERLKALRAELNLDYEQLERGILHFYTDPDEFERAIPQAALMREHGCEREVKTAAECLGIEPALVGAKRPIVGGTFTAGDESGNARLFTRALAARCAERGVAFRYGETIESLAAAGGQIVGVRLANGEIFAVDAVVMALGSWSPLLLEPLGIHVPVYPAKGYSATIPLAADALAPTVSLTDDGHKIVYSRLGDTLRVAGTAEFCGHDLSLDPARCKPILRRTFEMFPGVKRLEGIRLWTGLRPATPGNVPLVGPTKYGNLYLNTGHGTLGWTMAVGSGRLLADLVAGRAPEIDPSPYAMG
jgi:D-amino-acid dehydrogenase